MPTAVIEPKMQTRRAAPAGGRAVLRRICTMLSLVGWAAVSLLSGASLPGMLGFAAACFLYLLLPGWALADWLAPKGSSTPLMAAVYGCALLAGTHCVAVRLGFPWLLRLLPPLLAVVWLFRQTQQALPRLRGGAQTLLRTLDSGTGLFWAVLCLLYALCFGAVNPAPLQAGAVHLNQDMLWNVGNAAALSHTFPAQDIRFSVVRLSYHYLTELLSAALALTSGAEIYDIYVFFAGPLFLAGELVALKSLSDAYFGPEDKKAFPLLTALLYGFSCLSLWRVLPTGLSIFGNTLLQHLLTNINSQATALVFIGAFMVCFIRCSRAGFRVGWREISALFLSFFLLCVGKGPEAAIIVCSFAITMLLLLLRRPHYGKALFCLVGLCAVFAITYFVLFASGSNSMTLTIFAMKDYLCYQVLSPYADWLCAHLPVSGYVWLIGIGVIDAFCMLPLQFVLWISAMPGALRRLFKLDAAQILANGVVIGGFVGYHLFYHTSSSQVYFALVAMIFMSLLAVRPLERLLQGHLLPRCLIGILGAAALCSTVLGLGCYVRTGLGQLQSTIGWSDPHVTDDYWTAGDEEAMLWLRQNAPQDAMFATNRTSHTPEVLDAISNGYSAMSQRQAYMEGWTYAMTNMGVDRGVLEHKQNVNAALFSGCTAQEAAALGEQEHIRYLVLAKRWPGTPPQTLTPVFENDDVAIYALDGSAE